MPAGVAALQQLGVEIPDAARSIIAGVRYHDGDVQVAARLARPAYGIRRTVLAAALVERARAVGVEIFDETRVERQHVAADGVTLATSRGALNARLLVGADGLASRVRERAGLDRPASRSIRFGHRRHFACAPFSDHVEVHLGTGIEAYVTPVGCSIGVAFLWRDGALKAPPTTKTLLAHFPALSHRLDGVPFETASAGAGPFAREARALACDRVVLLGDAAGYIDAISGEGLSLALSAALDLAEVLPDAIARGGTAAAFAPYVHAVRRRFRRYALVVDALLFLSHRPLLRRATLRLLARTPALMRTTVAWATDLR